MSVGSRGRLGFGTGGLLRIDSARARQSVLAAALASGVTHFDTAPIYGLGESERALGRFLTGRRSEVTLATKFGLQPSRLAMRLAPLQRLGRRALRTFPALRRAAVRGSGALYSAPSFDAAAVRASLESSLRSLRTDHVDFFLAHQASSAASPGEDVIDLLEDLRRAGKILEFGVATEFAWLKPLLSERPRLARVVQFDSELTTGNIRTIGRGTAHLLITYGFINRSIVACRERLRDDQEWTARLRGVDDDALGGLLLRAGVLANPEGITLMQSRSSERIERNARAAMTASNDDLVGQLAALVGTAR